VNLFRRSRPSGERSEQDNADARRAHVLVEESREIVVVLDESRRVLATSRRARESLDRLEEGAPFPDEMLHVGGRRLRKVYDSSHPRS